MCIKNKCETLINNFKNLDKMQKAIKTEIQKRTSQQGISTRNGT